MKQSLFILTFLGLTAAASSQSFIPKMDSLFSTLWSNNKFMGSVAISKNGKIVYANAVGYAAIDDKNKIPATIHTRYRIGSITKMFTGVIILQLAQENKLSLEDKLSKYYPQIPNADKITIDNMLNHRSGIHNFTDDSLYMTYHQTPRTKAQLLDIFKANASDFEPGSKADYSNAAYLLLGYIAEDVTKKSYANLVRERITDKLGLKDTYVGGAINLKNAETYSYTYGNGWKQQTVTDMSIPSAAGALLSTPTDLNLFITGLFNGKLLSQSSLEKMMDIKDGYGRAMVRFPFYDKTAYGHNGGIDGFISTVAHFPKDSVSIAVVSNGLSYNYNDVLLGLLSIYFNKPYKIPAFSSYTVNPTDINKYAGTYYNETLNMKLTVSSDNGALAVQATGQPMVHFQPTGKDEFTYEKASAVLVFDVANKNVMLKQGGGEFVFNKE